MNLQTRLNYKVCNVCTLIFMQSRPMQNVCGPVCGGKVGKLARKAEREKTKERKQADKPIGYFRAQAQEVFNEFIRARDANLPCVSCQTTNPPMTRGGQWDAGHFLSRGAYPELAFNEDNCHKQCKSCNAGSGKFSHKARTVSQKYELEIVTRIGADRFAILRGPHELPHLKKEDYIAIRDDYRAKLKEVRAEI